MSQRPPLSRRAQSILDMIVAHIAEHGYAPSSREIADHENMASLSGVKYQLDVLEARGYISRRSDVARAITVLSEPVERDPDYKPKLADIKRTHSGGDRCKSAHCDVPALIRAVEAVIEDANDPVNPLATNGQIVFGIKEQAKHTLAIINQHLTVGATDE